MLVAEKSLRHRVLQKTDQHSGNKIGLSGVTFFTQVKRFCSSMAVLKMPVTILPW
jgi:hypothetical protein